MSGRGGYPAPGGEDWRRARRAWIATHHPDRGGDLEVFITGLRQWARPGPPGPGGPREAPVTAYYRRGPAGAWRWLTRAARQRARARAARRRARFRRVT